jgi:hypothetical protein
MQYLYAQLDKNGVCAGVSQLSGIVERDDMIPLTEEEYTDDLIGRIYEDGTWGDKVIVEPVDPPSVEQLKPILAAIAEQEAALRIILEVDEVEES